MTMVVIGLLIIWNLVLTYFVWTTTVICMKNYDEIEAIKSWYPFCEIMKIRIPKDKGGDDE